MKSTIDTESIKTDIFDPYIQCKNTQKGEGVVPVLKYTERGGGRPGIKIHRKGRGSSRYLDTQKGERGRPGIKIHRKGRGSSRY